MNDRDRTLKIPLPPLPKKDKIIWMPAQGGENSVKRGYWFAHYLNSLSNEVLNPSTSVSTQRNFWKHIWNAQTLPGLSHWAWQASLDRLPTNAQLAKRNIISNDFCTYCGNKTETIFHMLYDCDFAFSIRTLNPDAYLGFDSSNVSSIWNQTDSA